MVDDTLRQSERTLALGYAPAERRVALTALFALDGRLRAIARAAREPLIGLMRLTWWREALERLDGAPAPAEPLLRSLAAEVLPLGITGAALARLTGAWERVVEGEVDWGAVAVERAVLFELAADLLGRHDARVAPAGAAWALTDLMRDWPEAARPAASAFDLYGTAWPVPLRPLGALGLLARSDLETKSPPGSPRRVLRLLAHRVTGR